VQKHRDSLFVIFTNGTMIDDAVAERLGWMGNATVALSVEGMEESTDARRGPGMFDRVLESISHLRAHGAAFGISATVTRDNCLELMSDEFLDYFFFELDAFYGFLFQYMPVGGDYRVELMPTPAQRLEFWRRSWEVIEKKKVFLFDFWNHGTLVHGCVAAGRERGYLHVDWDGKVTPCVFAQYSTGNVHDVFSRGGDLNDIWDSPFFRAVREWQRGYGYGPEVPSREGNWLAPCPVRDHHGAFRGLLDEHHPEPENEPASKALSDDDYYEGLVSYGEELARLSRDVWEGEYL
jgi:MoaA/NifB/PqqE/SkfB family radical SAM enzyme